MISLTNSTELKTDPCLYIRVQAGGNILDSCIGRTKDDVSTDLRTIIKSCTMRHTLSIPEVEQIEELSVSYADDATNSNGRGFLHSKMYEKKTTKHRKLITSKLYIVDRRTEYYVNFFK